MQIIRPVGKYHNPNFFHDLRTSPHKLGTLTVVRAQTVVEKRIRNTSDFFYRLKSMLTVLGLDVIKKDAGKDGNLTSEGNYYVRDRKRRFFIHDDLYQIRNIARDYNAGEEITLCIKRIWTPVSSSRSSSPHIHREGYHSMKDRTVQSLINNNIPPPLRVLFMDTTYSPGEDFDTLTEHQRQDRILSLLEAFKEHSRSVIEDITSLLNTQKERVQ
jgi:hypothetical protein